MKLIDIFDMSYSTEELEDFELKMLIMSYIRSHDLHKIVFRDRLGVEFYIKFYENGCVYLEPTYYKDEEQAVQLRIPILDLLEYEVRKA